MDGPAECGTIFLMYFSIRSAIFYTMPKDKRIDAYIAKSPQYAQPILKHIRQLVHSAIPEAEEDIKWSHPAFVYYGNVCMMAAFKSYAIITFWKGKLMADPDGILQLDERDAVGHLGLYKSLKDMPSDKLMKKYIKEAARLNKEGIKLPPKPKKEKEELVIPEPLIKALSKNKKAQKAFGVFSYSHKKEYVQWITEAKTEETRNKRIATALEWIVEGKGRNWKYER
jgi:uncharacterized protein YdeI (YjbR/CyaY-like superfamily)